MATNDEAVAFDDEAKARILEYLYRAEVPETYWGKLYWEVDTQVRARADLGPQVIGRRLWRLLAELTQEGRIVGNATWYRLTAKQWLSMTRLKQCY